MRKIKWGVLGTADIFAGQTSKGMMLAENCERYAIAGRSLAKAEDFRERFGFEKAYGSYEELLTDEAVEAVYIPLPNTLHYEWTIKALQHKKHVLCEKPLAPTEKTAAEMFAEAEKNGVYLMEAFAYQHSPYMAALEDEVQRGAVGDVRYVETAFLTSDYDISNIRMRKETLGGATYDLGVYCTSFVLRVLGLEPKSVQAVCSKSPDGIDTFTNILLEYENGIRADLSCGMVLATGQARRMDRFQIHGTKGTIKSQKFEYNKEGNMSYEVRSFDGVRAHRDLDVPQNYSLEVEQFGRCIAEGETPAVTKEFSLANARMIDRILEAIKY